jgi:lipopolysaccharide heptosyltransferase II
LLIRPDHIGDVLLGADAVALLRASMPRAHITYLVGPWAAEAARGGPQVDAIRTLEFPGFTRQAKANIAEPYLTLARVAATLRRERYDLAVVLRPDHWWGALLVLAAGIPFWIGTATPETTPLLTHAYTQRDEHAAQHALEVARLAISTAQAEPLEVQRGPQFSVRQDAIAQAGELWRSHKLEGRQVVGIHPSAGAPLKSWPTERWAQLADAVSGTGARVVLIGAPGDRELLASIRQQMRGCAPKLCGQSLQVSAALYARCAVVVSVDSGAGHLAAAVGTPTVRLYGPAPPSVFGPWPPTPHQRVLMSKALACVPCGDLERPPCGARTTPACMQALGVDDVLKGIKANLSRG